METIYNRQELLSTKEKILKLLLKRKLKHFINVDQGWFTYIFKVSNRKIRMDFKHDDVSYISFNPETTVKEIASDCDCISIIDITDTEPQTHSKEMVYWQYNGDS